LNRADAVSTRKTTLETVLARWRTRLPPGTSPAAFDAFVQRNRPALEDMVARKAATRGELPETAREFAAYDPLVARERARDAEPDERVWQRLSVQFDRRVRRGMKALEALANFGLDYVNARGEALLLQGAGWDALALLLARPALAVLAAGSVVAVRDTFGRLAIHPGRRGTLNHLHADLGETACKMHHFGGVARRQEDDAHLPWVACARRAGEALRPRERGAREVVSRVRRRHGA
jgi:hypothetical protein